MSRADLDLHFVKIDELIDEINTIVPPSTGYSVIQFRADLAGLLVVAIAATYETCVKEILYEFARQQHTSFGEFARRNYRKLNSKISVKDLKDYCELFNPSIKEEFQRKLSERKRIILERTGKNIEISYQQILSWRHEYAHARVRNTTIEEVTNTHLLGKRILYVFDEAFTTIA